MAQGSYQNQTLGKRPLSEQISNQPQQSLNTQSLFQRLSSNETPFQEPLIVKR